MASHTCVHPMGSRTNEDQVFGGGFLSLYVMCLYREGCLKVSMSTQSCWSSKAE